MIPNICLPFRNCFQHRALVPSYLITCAGATSLCAEGREGWQDKAPLPLGALISSFRPRSFVFALRIPPWCHLSPFLEKGVPQPPFLLQHSSSISSPAPKSRGDAVWSPLCLGEECQHSCTPELAASILPWPRGCFLLSEWAMWAGCACADRSTLLLAQLRAGWALPSQMPLEKGREGLSWPFHIAVV